MDKKTARKTGGDGEYRKTRAVVHGWGGRVRGYRDVDCRDYHGKNKIFYSWKVYDPKESYPLQTS